MKKIDDKTMPAEIGTIKLEVRRVSLKSTVPMEDVTYTGRILDDTIVAGYSSEDIPHHAM